MSTIAAESLADVVQKLGGVHLNRIRMRPAPGTATAEDVARIRDQEKRLYELVDGILVEKAMGFRQSLVAMSLGRIIGNFVNTNKSGLVIGADGMLRLSQSSVRIPDVAFIAWQRLPHGSQLEFF